LPGLPDIQQLGEGELGKHIVQHPAVPTGWCWVDLLMTSLCCIRQMKFAEAAMNCKLMETYFVVQSLSKMFYRSDMREMKRREAVVFKLEMKSTQRCLMLDGP
jgi:hypothetical protein